MSFRTRDLEQICALKETVWSYKDQNIVFNVKQKLQRSVRFTNLVIICAIFV